MNSNTGECRKCGYKNVPLIIDKLCSECFKGG